MKRISTFDIKPPDSQPPTFDVHDRDSDQKDQLHFSVPQISLQTSRYYSTTPRFHDDKAQNILIKVVIDPHRRQSLSTYRLILRNMQNQNHPLPSPPGNQERPGNRPRAKTSSGFSLHSHKSSGSGQKLDLTESHREKEAKRLHSKADPSLAMTEAEPCEYSFKSWDSPFAY